jgi:DNA adenine methylase
VRYPGSKARFTKDLVRIVQEHRGSRDVYLEPFIGGANSFAALAPLFTYSAGGDAHQDIAMMWEAVGCNWLPPEHVSEELYQSLRHAEPSALRGFVGSGCSFGGKWFGGYARGGFNADGTPRDHQAESYRAVAKKAPALARPNVHISNRSFEHWTDTIDRSFVVYCDPPYVGTLKYETKMDHELFWKCADQWVDSGALVLVSEQTAPRHWQPVHTISRKSSTALASVRTNTDEHVFMRVGR